MTKNKGGGRSITATMHLAEEPEDSNAGVGRAAYLSRAKALEAGEPSFSTPPNSHLQQFPPRDERTAELKSAGAPIRAHSRSASFWSESCAKTARHKLQLSGCCW